MIADFRFDPIGGKAEAISGVAQFGSTLDEFGHRAPPKGQHRGPAGHRFHDAEPEGLVEPDEMEQGDSPSE